jgi:penicillin amidase
MTGWSWGKLHTLPLRHVLAGRGDLGQLLNHGGLAVPGTYHSVCNTCPGPDFAAASGAGYRLIADLSSQPPALWAVDAQSQSGHPGSPHYRDQFTEWLAGRYHCLSLDRAAASRTAVTRLVLSPQSADTP